MLKLRTKTAFTIPAKRGVTNSIVRLIIDGLKIDNNNIVASGYYYFYDENGDVVKLDDIAGTPMLWDNIEAAEFNLLPALESTANLKDNIMQRLTEFVFIRLQEENGVNYATIRADWEIDLD